MSVKKRWFQGTDGGTSTMRVMVVWGATVGTFLILAGTVAMFINNPQASVAIGAGTGLFSIGEMAKALQAQKEL